MELRHYALLASLCLFSLTVNAQTIISEDRAAGVWTKANDPYIITKDITVPSRSSLTIEAGVQVRFRAGVKMNIEGRLEALGRESEPISFSSENSNDTWNGLHFSIGNDGFSDLRFILLEDATEDWISCDDAKVIIRNSQLRNNAKGDIRVNGTANLQIIGSEISNNNSTTVLSMYGASQVALINVFLTDNQGDNPGYWDTVISGSPAEGAGLKIVNSTIANNSGSFSFAIPKGLIFVNSILWKNRDVFGRDFESAHVLNSNIEGGYVGPGNIDAPPAFVNELTGDYSLRSSSPCKDAGHVAAFYNDWDGTRNDMGATGGSGLYVLPEYDFGPAGVGQSKKWRVEFMNARSEAVVISGLHLSNAIHFDLTDIQPYNIPPFSSAFFDLFFQPAADGVIEAKVTLNSTDFIGSTDGEISFKGLGGIWSGEVSGVWEKSMSPIIVGRDVTVPVNRSLLIRPGVEVLMVSDDEQGPLEFIVEGTLTVEGRELEPVLFSSNHPVPAPGDWAGVRLQNKTNARMILNHCVVEYAEDGLISANERLSVNNTTFRYCSGSGLFLRKGSRSQSLVGNSVFRENGEWGIKLQSLSGCEISALVDPVIEGNLVVANGLGGIKVEALGRTGCSFVCFCIRGRSSQCSPILNNNRIDNNQGQGIEIVADGVIDSPFRRPAAAEPVIERCILMGNAGGVSTQEKRDFGESLVRVSVDYCTLWNNGPSTFLVQDSSEITIWNSIVWSGNSADITLQNGGQATIAYSNFPQIQPGEGNISMDPLFRNAAGGDFRLTCTSPCIDAGDPADAADPDGTAADMGALWFDQTFIANFSYEILDADACSGQTTVRFRPQLQISEDLNADSYRWDFGDAAATTEETPLHTFTEGGPFDISLTVGDRDCNIERNILKPDLIEEVNEPPRVVGTLSKIDGKEDASFFGLLLGAVFEDDDGERLDFGVSTAEHLNVYINNGRLGFTPAPDWFGEETVVLTARDGKGCEAQLPVQIVVAPVNDPPVIDAYDPVSAEFSVEEMMEQSFSISALDIDNPPSELRYSWFVDNEPVFVGSNQFSYNFPGEGLHFVKGIVSDGEYRVEISWTVTVNPVVDAPFVNLPGVGLNIYPNPFSGRAFIEVALREKSTLVVEVYDARGALVRTLFSGELASGEHIFVWDGDEVAAGVYWVRVRSGRGLASWKLVGGE